MNAIQLDFFKTEQECEIESLINQFNTHKKETKESADKVRKSLFAKNGELKKKVDELETRLSILEKNICKKEES